MQSLYLSGKAGEERALRILKGLGFTTIEEPEPWKLKGASNLNMKRMGQKFAINVKNSSSGGPFIVTWGNLRRLVQYSKHGYKPAFMFLFDGTYYMFTLEDNFPQNRHGVKDEVIEHFGEIEKVYH